MTRLVIIQGTDLIADIPDFTGPIPRVGEYIGRPALDGSYSAGIVGTGQISGCVKVVVHNIMGRDFTGVRGHFIGHDEPFVQVSI
jgi:hypothetical protein